MNEHERKLWLEQMALAAERRARVEGHRHVIATARVVRVETGVVNVPRVKVTAPPPPMAAKRCEVTVSWRAMLDGFELAMFAPSRSTRLFVPEHLLTTGSDRAWRRWEVS